MDAIELIKQDHLRIEELFGKFFETESEITQEALFQQIETGLTAHAEMEERVLYPAVNEFAADKVEEALNEHSEVENLLAELLDVDLNEEDFESRFEKLIDNVRQHIADQEAPGGILAIAAEHLNTARLSEMAKDMQNIRRETEEDMAA